MSRQADVLLADGAAARLRPVTPADADALVALYSRFSDRTRYLRYFSPYPRIPKADLHRFVTVDHHDREALAVWIGDHLVGVGRYDRLGQGAEEAEVAFAVEDAHQGRGIGSVLLEHLAAAAAQAGIVRFVAEVLPQNSAMLRVFTQAGYEVQRRFREGVVHLTFPITPTERSREAQWAREQRAEAASIAPLLAPRGVVVYGVRRDGTGIGATLLANLRSGGFTGRVAVVHPAGAPGTYQSATQAPGPWDLAVVATPAQAVPAVLDDAAAAGVRGLLVLSAGFAEIGEAGAAAQRELVRSAYTRGMRLVGPNCFGVSNPDPAVRLNATLAPHLPEPGRVGLFSQSGAFGIALLAEAHRRGVGLSGFVAAGNRADVAGNDFLQYWRDDPRTDVVLLYLESFGNPRKFARVARMVGRTTPLVAVAPRVRPVGEGRLLAEAAKAALFAHSGVIRVHTVAEMFDVAALLAHQPLPAGRRVGIVTNSAALGGLAQSACDPAGLAVADGYPQRLGPETGPDQLAEALAEAIADPATDALVVALVPPAPPLPVEAYAATVAQVTTGADKPVVVTALAGAAQPGPHYPSVEEAVQALARVAGYAQWRREPPGQVPELPEREPARVAEALAQGRDRDALAGYGIHAGEAAPGPGVACVIEVDQDPGFGPVIGFGLAGPATDLLGDWAWRLVPLTDRDAATLVRAPLAAPMLTGWHGADPVDLAGLADLLIRVARLADEQPRLRKLRLDLVASAGGVTVRRAHLRTGDPAQRPDTGPRRLARS